MKPLPAYLEQHLERKFESSCLLLAVLIEESPESVPPCLDVWLNLLSELIKAISSVCVASEWVKIASGPPTQDGDRFIGHPDIIWLE